MKQREIGGDSDMWMGWRTELKLGLAEAFIQVLGWKHEGFVFGLLNLDTRQRHILRERRRMTAKLWRQIIRRYPYCLRCKTTENLTVDHITPLYLFGKTEWGNLQTLCGKCNRQKGTRYADYRK